MSKDEIIRWSHETLKIYTSLKKENNCVDEESYRSGYIDGIIFVLKNLIKFFGEKKSLDGK